VAAFASEEGRRFACVGAWLTRFTKRGLQSRSVTASLFVGACVGAWNQFNKGEVCVALFI
jgi:hypothetical protein